MTGAAKKCFRLFQQTLRKTGMDLVPYPLSDWTRERHALQSLFHKLGINCVIDVGANRGQFGSQLRDFGYAGRIASFEPVRDTFERLTRTAAGHAGSWELFQYALGAAETKEEINVSEGTEFSSFLAPREDSQSRFPGNHVERTEAVQVKRLDDVLDECAKGLESPRIYLKMDTQGYDLEVIKGAERSLPKIVALQTEVSFQAIYHGMNGFADSICTLGTRGFDVFDFVPVTRDSEGLGVIEMDCIMVRRNSR
jgi:FkbM family methyltransferase